MPTVELTNDDLALVRALRRYLALGDPLGPRATVPNIVRYLALTDASDAAARRGARREAVAYWLQRNGLERQPLLSWLATIGTVLALLLVAVFEAWQGWGDFNRIMPAAQAVVSAATSPNFAKMDPSLLVPDPLRGRFTPDPQGAFAPVVEDYRQRAEARLDQVRAAITGTAAHFVAAFSALVLALVVATVQPHELVRRWLLPVVGWLLLAGDRRPADRTLPRFPQS
jgi:hypothetical protein